MSADINLRDIDNAEPGMSPLKSGVMRPKRYVLSIHPDDLEVFDQVCRERCHMLLLKLQHMAT